MSYEHLTAEQVEQFITQGYTTIKNCFDADATAPRIDKAWSRIGFDRHDPSTWVEKRVHLSQQEKFDAQAFAPKAWNAAMELLGGEDRVHLPWHWGDGLIANLGVGDDRPWEPPSPQVTGWHKDGDFFRHFLDSPEQGLLTIVMWTDMLHQGGGTFVATDSVGVIARYLAEHPEGVLPADLSNANLISQCKDFVELTGELGDVVLIHPYVLHATSQNVLQHGRFITNPPIALREPMNFDRADSADFSAVERAVLHGLGVERYAFTPTADREDVVPPRIARQQERDRLEAERLAAS